MDAETWNAYHIMNNRARAVCYASRQQQFRALAEMTVNKLMSTAHDHIEALSSLQVLNRFFFINIPKIYFVMVQLFLIIIRMYGGIWTVYCDMCL